jgi:hypothetical protein
VHKNEEEKFWWWTLSDIKIYYVIFIQINQHSQAKQHLSESSQFLRNFIPLIVVTLKLYLLTQQVIKEEEIKKLFLDFDSIPHSLGSAVCCSESFLLPCLVPALNL